MLQNIPGTTGEVLRLDPDTVVLVDGRPVALDQVRPGTSIVIQRGDAGRVAVAQPPVVVTQPPVVAQPPAVVTQPPVAAHPPVVVQPPPVDASGIVAHVDRRTGVITFQDGRAFQLRPAEVGHIQPGMRVLVREARPVAIEPTRAHRVGRVQWIDPHAGQMMLHDGTLVHLSPQTRYHAGDRTVTITDVRRGDRVVVFESPPTPGGVTVTVHDGAALPREVVAGVPARPGTTVIWAQDVRIYRGEQAP